LSKARWTGPDAAASPGPGENPCARTAGSRTCLPTPLIPRPQNHSSCSPTRRLSAISAACRSRLSASRASCCRPPPGLLRLPRRRHDTNHRAPARKQRPPRRRQAGVDGVLAPRCGSGALVVGLVSPLPLSRPLPPLRMSLAAVSYLARIS
jgi:hypothetical protein